MGIDSIEKVSLSARNIFVKDKLNVPSEAGSSGSNVKMTHSNNPFQTQSKTSSLTSAQIAEHALRLKNGLFPSKVLNSNDESMMNLRQQPSIENIKTVLEKNNQEFLPYTRAQLSQAELDKYGKGLGGRGGGQAFHIDDKVIKVPHIDNMEALKAKGLAGLPKNDIGACEYPENGAKAWNYIDSNIYDGALKDLATAKVISIKSEFTASGTEPALVMPYVKIKNELRTLEQIREIRQQLLNMGYVI